MYCPRCGTPNEPNDRFCSSCGNALGGAASPGEGRGVRERFDRLIGTTRGARIATIATAVAIVVAIASFAALEPEEDGIPRDDYTLAAERICLDAKREIFGVGQSFRESAGAVSASTFARGLLPAVTGWRLRLTELKAPADRAEEAAALAAALREVEVRIAQLARAAGGADRKRTVAIAARADEASTSVEGAISALGLTECASVKLGLVPE